MTSPTEMLRDLGVVLADRPGSLAEFGGTLGAAGVSLEGGGVFTHDGQAIAHFLVDHPERARHALQARAIGPVTISEVVAVRLDQDVPGQLGSFMQRVADAGINVVVQYSDHGGRLVLVVEPERLAECRAVAARWDDERRARRA
jgi:hypothetical protein